MHFVVCAIPCSYVFETEDLRSNYIYRVGFLRRVKARCPDRFRDIERERLGAAAHKSERYWYTDERLRKMQMNSELPSVWPAQEGLQTWNRSWSRRSTPTTRWNVCVYMLSASIDYSLFHCRPFIDHSSYPEQINVNRTQLT